MWGLTCFYDKGVKTMKFVYYNYGWVIMIKLKIDIIITALFHYPTVTTFSVVALNTSNMPFMTVAEGSFQAISGTASINDLI